MSIKRNGLLILLSVVIVFLSLYIAMNNLKSPDRYVTVRGLSERSVRADTAVWTISFSTSDQSIERANERIAKDRLLILDFLKAHRIQDQEIATLETRVIDLFCRGDKPAPETPRYQIRSAIRVTSARVLDVQSANAAIGEVMRQGVMIGAEYDNGPNPVYYFSGLQSLRPEMFSQALKSAHELALQFSRDTQTPLGSIRRAYQGVFEVSGLAMGGDYQSSQNELASIDKKVRLVCTIDYILR